MFVIANFVVGVASVLNFLLEMYFWVVVAAAVLSWVNPDPYNPIVRFLRSTTEPVLYWIRRRLPVAFGGVDLSPIVVLAGIKFLKWAVVANLFALADVLR